MGGMACMVGEDLAGALPQGKWRELSKAAGPKGSLSSALSRREVWGTGWSGVSHHDALLLEGVVVCADGCHLVEG